MKTESSSAVLTDSWPARMPFLAFRDQERQVLEEAPNFHEGSFLREEVPAPAIPPQHPTSHSGPSKQGLLAGMLRGWIRKAREENHSAAQGSIRKFILLGIRIASITPDQAAEFACKGGLILAPSGPGLCNVAYDPNYCRALQESDLNLPDSILAIAIMFFLGIGRLQRTSGLGFLRALLQRKEIREEGASFWVMPNTASMRKNLDYLSSVGIPLREEECYVAPIYPKTGEVRDFTLLNELNLRRPKFVMICTGSGSQEKLGAWLKRRLDYQPTICCIGAAIAFESGDQIHIPRWADAVGLGWLFRCISDPKVYVPRYFKSLELIYLSISHRRSSPLHAPKLLVKNGQTDYIAVYLLIQGLAVYGSFLLWHSFLEAALHRDILAHHHYQLAAILVLMSTLITRLVRLQKQDYIITNNGQNLRAGISDWAVTSIVCLACVVLTRDQTVSRTFIATYLPMLLLINISCNLLLPSILSKWIFRTLLQSSTILIPYSSIMGERTSSIRKMHTNWVNRTAHIRKKITGQIGEHPSPGLDHIPHLGSMNDLGAICESHRVRHAIVLIPNSKKPNLERLIRDCKQRNVLVSAVTV